MSRVAIVVVGHGVHAQLPGLLASIPLERLADVILVDDGSSPPLVAPAPPLAAAIRIERHTTNQGYGAAQKTGYLAAIAAGFDRVVLLHGDAQYPTGPVLGLADALDDADLALGSRFLHDEGRSIPRWRCWGNRALTGLANLRFGSTVSELHTGARAFRMDFLRGLAMDRMSDDYVFDQQVLVHALRTGARIAERPMPVRYDDAVQSIRLGPALRYAAGCVVTIVRG